MKTKQQIAHELHDYLTEKWVELEIEVRYLRLEGKEKEKNKKMIERDEIELRLSLLDEFIKKG